MPLSYLIYGSVFIVVVTLVLYFFSKKKDR